MLFVSMVDARWACTYRHVCYLYGRCLGGCTSGRVPIGMFVVCMVDVWVGVRHWACCLNAWSMSVQVNGGVLIIRHNTVCLTGPFLDGVISGEYR